MGGKTSTSTSSTTIPPEVLARYNSVNQQAQKVASAPYQSYSNDANAYVAALNPTQTSAISQAGAYQNAAQPYYNAATGLTMAGAQQANLSSLNTNQYLSPYLSTVLGANIAAQNNQNAQQASQLTGNAITSGAFGGDRSGIAQANLAYQQGLSNNASNAALLNQGYTQAQSVAQQQQSAELAAQQANLARLTNAGNQFASLGTGAQNAAESGAAAALQAGTAQQQTQQAGLTALYQNFQQQAAYPFQVAQFLANIAEGTGALSGSTTTTTQPAPFFSDERLKYDVERVGETDEGQNVYKFKYKNDPSKRTYLGLMAGEVEKTHPEAMGLANGYKTVDYDKATDGRHHLASGGDVIDFYNYLGKSSPTGLAAATPQISSYVPSNSSGAPSHLMTGNAPAAQKQQSAIQEAQSALNAGKTVGDLYSSGKAGLFGTAATANSPATTGLLSSAGKVGDTGGYLTGANWFASGGSVDDDTTPYNDSSLIGDVVNKGTQNTDELLHGPNPVTQQQQSGFSQIGQAASGIGTLAGGLGSLFGLFFKDGGSVPREHHADGNVVGSDDDAAYDFMPNAPSGLISAAPSAKQDAILAASKSAMPNGYWDRLVKIESGGDPNNVTGSNVGLAQFAPKDMAQYGLAGADPRDPAVARMATEREAAANAAAFNKQFGRDPTPGELYVMHQQGQAGGLALMANRDTPAAEAIQRFYGSPEIANKAIVGNLGKPGMTAGDFVDMWTNKFDGTRAPANQYAMNSNGTTSDVGLGSSLDSAANAYMAPASMTGMKSQPAPDQGGLSGLLTSEKFWLPALTGLGAMASSPSRYLGSAILQGLGAGAQSYQNLEQQQAQRSLEQQRLGIEQQRVGIDLTSKNLGVLTQLRQIAAGYAAKGLPVPPEIANQISTLTRTITSGTPYAGAQTQAVATVGNLTPKPQVAAPPTIEQAPAQQPSGRNSLGPDLAKQGAAAQASEPVPMTPQGGAALGQATGQNFYSRLDPNANPQVLRQRAQEAAAYNPELSEKLQNQALELEKAIAERGYGVGPNGEIVEVPGWRDRKLSLEAAAKSNDASVSKRVENNANAYQEAWQTAQSAADLGNNLQAARSKLFDENGNPKVNAGPKGELITNVASLMRQVGMSDETIKAWTGTNPDDANALKKLTTTLGSEIGRSEIGGIRAQQEFNRFIASVPSDQILPEASKWLIDHVMMPRVEQQKGAYRAIQGLDPGKDDVRGALQDYKEKHPFFTNDQGAAQPQDKQSQTSAPISPTAERQTGVIYTIKGKPYKWTGTGWLPQ